MEKNGKKTTKTKSTNNNLQEEVSKYINNNINEIKETMVLVFIEEEINENQLVTTINEHGVVCNFEKLKPIQIVKRLKGIVVAYKVSVNDETLQYLIEMCGTSMQILINEIRKLIEYSGEGGTITKADIDKLAIKQLESVIFDLTDNLGQKKIKKSMDILSELLYNKEPIQRILVTLYNHFKKLYLVKLSDRYKMDIKEGLKLKPTQMFLISKYRKQADYFTEEELRILLEELINLDNNYKIGLIDVIIGLEAILCRYCS